MHWLARVFASAIARRIAYVVVAAFIGWLSVGRASAADCETAAEQCTQPQAYAACIARTQAAAASRPQHRNVQCLVYSTKTYRGQYEYTNNNTQWFVAYSWLARWSKGCADESEYTGVGPWSSVGGMAKSGSLGCMKGCDGMWGKNADSTYTWTPLGNTCPDDQKKNCEAMGSGHFWNALLKVCEPPNNECPKGGKPNSLGQCAPEPCPDGMSQQPDGTCKKKDNECPAGEIRSPDGKCLPGEGQCAKGETRGKDGTCKKDQDEDGEPDEPGEGEGGEKPPNEFSGGDDCSRPPSCSGDAIMCGQARIQWRIECNTRKNRNIAGGMCGSQPICTGEKCDALEYTQLLMQWRTACAVEKLAAVSQGGGSGENADLAAIRNALTGNAGDPDIGSEGSPTAAFSDESGYGQAGYPGTFNPDTSGFGYARTCPTIPSVSVMGQTLTFDTSVFCSWIILGGQFVLVIASIVSLRIISAGGTA